MIIEAKHLIIMMKTLKFRGVNGLPPGGMNKLELELAGSKTLILIIITLTALVAMS